MQYKKKKKNRADVENLYSQSCSSSSVSSSSSPSSSGLKDKLAIFLFCSSFLFFSFCFSNLLQAHVREQWTTVIQQDAAVKSLLAILAAKL